MMDSVVIFGCGYTGSRVAQRLQARGTQVIAPRRDTFDALQRRPGDLDFVPAGARVLYSIPALEPADPAPAIVADLAQQRRVKRLVYLSTTGVYGSQTDVDEHTQPAPRRPSDDARLAAERAVLSGAWSALVLRPAAIYGPGRGVHVSMQEGRFRVGGDGSNFVSRIHVDDLAAHCVAALFTDHVTGAWPVADDEPCTTRDIVEFCADLMSLPLPERVATEDLHHTRQANRRVDGSAVRRALGIDLRYPTYRTGIPASAGL